MNKCAHSEGLFPKRFGKTEGPTVAYQNAIPTYDHFTDAILAACARDTDVVSSEEISDWAWSAAVALRFGESKPSIIGREDTELTHSRIKEDTRLREVYFWASLSLADELEPEREPWSRYVWEVMQHENILGEMTKADVPWLFKALERFYFMRTGALSLSML